MMRKRTLISGGGLFAALVITPVFAQSPEADRPRDEDGDGYISRAEMEASRQRMFDALDTDGDGVLSAAEFLAPAMERFDKIDKDGDDRLSKDEMKDARPSRGRFRRNRD